jgi:hypothetical protein
MKAVEFITELSGATVLHIPSEVAAQLPKGGRARVIVLTGEGDEEAEWRQGAYAQFLRDDAPEDAIYDSLH